MHAVAFDVLVIHNVAALREVPGCALVDVLRINGIRRGLDVNSVGPEAHEGDVEEQRKDWEEDLEEPEGCFDEPEKHA